MIRLHLWPPSVLLALAVGDGVSTEGAIVVVLVVVVVFVGSSFFYIYIYVKCVGSLVGERLPWRQNLLPHLDVFQHFSGSYTTSSAGPDVWGSVPLNHV